MEPPFDIAADLHTPVSAFLRLKEFGPAFLLESVEAGHSGRYSFIGFGRRRQFTIGDDGIYEAGRKLAGGIVAGLRLALRETAPRSMAPGTELIPFGGGLVGVAGFDLVRCLNGLPPSRHPDRENLGVYVVSESILVFDHLTRRIALLHTGSDAERQSLRADVIAALLGPAPGSATPKPHGPATPSMTEPEFVAGVDRVKDHIRAGDVYQLVLSVRFHGETSIDPFTAYRAMRLLNPSPYMYFVDLGAMQVVGSSPEALARLEGRTAELRPIAGTRRRGVDRASDAQLEEELLADPKEAAEHVMLVDLARNDLGRVASVGTVKVDPYRIVERYSHVMHLVSGVTGTLRPELDAFDLFAAAFPAGTVSGAPKLRSVELIDELEPVGRGLYSGSVGYFGHTGSMDQAITIRTLVFENGGYSYQAGAGIVADSDPASEHTEVLAKSGAMESTLQLAKEGL